MIYKLPDKGDPSDEMQLFPRFNLQLLCCRYWWLRNWEFGELSYPYWRIYWNPVPGAKIIYKNTEIELQRDKIIMIAPSTSYSAKLFDHEIPSSGYLLNGGRIGRDKNEEKLEEFEISHLFIHFNIGIPYDNIAPQIIVLDMNEQWLEKLTNITHSLKSDFQKFDFYTSLVIRSLIFDMLASIPEKKWEIISSDKRILDILEYIENNLHKNLSNSILSGKINLATNAFSRLFKAEVGLSPQQYLKKKRIDRACALLDHSQNSIDTIADETGFADRYHFSKIFKQITGISPGKYRKEFSL